MKNSFIIKVFLTILFLATAGSANAEETTCPTSIHKSSKQISNVVDKLSDLRCNNNFSLHCENSAEQTYKVLSINFDNSCYGWDKNNISSLEFFIIENDYPSAFANIVENESKNTALIAISSSMMNEITSADQLAFVVAHEIAHLLNNHIRENIEMLVLTTSQQQQIKNIHKNWEMDADNKAFMAISRAGFDHKKAISLLGKLAKYESHNASSNHPSINERIHLAKSRHSSVQYFNDVR